MEVVESNDYRGDLVPARHGRRQISNVFLLFVTVCCAIAATRFSANPLLIDLARTFHTVPKHVSLMITLTQLGTMVGIILFVPFADAFRQRHLTMGLLFLLCLGLMGMATASSLTMLFIMSFVEGVGSGAHHLITPWAVGIAPEDRRGRVVGWMHGGAVTGTLIGMVVAGAVAQFLSWRAVYWSFSGLFGLLIVLVYWSKPPRKAVEKKPWKQVALGTFRLLKNAELRRISIAGAFLFCSYNALWLSLGIFLRTPPYHFGSFKTSLLASIGFLGVFVSVGVGRFMDRFRGNTMLICSFMTVAVACVILSFARHHRLTIFIGFILLDAGIRSGQVATQAKSLMRERTDYARATTVYMVIYLFGGMIGSAASGLLWHRYGWEAVCMFSFIAAIFGLTFLSGIRQCVLAEEIITLPDAA